MMQAQAIRLRCIISGLSQINWNMQAGKLISKYITATIGIITVIVAAINCNDMFCLKKIILNMFIKLLIIPS